jgi:monoterpene epsilon-lactone hydrolase
MTSPEMQQLIGLLAERSARRTEQPAPSLAERRAIFSPAGQQHPIPQDVSITTAFADGVPVHWLSAPRADSNRVIFYLHGGGYSLGSLQSHGELASRLGRASEMNVLMVDYRLAPEHPFPAALDDALTVWRWLGGQLANRQTTCAIIGDSAGGGLAVAVMVALRDAGDSLPASAVLMSPWTDLSCSAESIHAAPDPVLTPEGLALLASNYLAGADAESPLASPLFASLHGLPPMLIQVGTAELLLDDSVRLSQAAASAGVEVTLQIAEGMPHVYQSMLGAPEAASATADVASFLGATTQTDLWRSNREG